MSYKNTTVLLPAMDETYSLQETVETIAATCKADDLAEIILILCSRSTQKCRETAEQLVQRFEKQMRIYIYDQKRPFVGRAIQEGIDLAVGSHLVMMSSDLETDPKLVERFIELAKKEPDKIITASRWLKGGGFQNYNSVKLVCNMIFEKLIAVFFGVRLSDLTFGYRHFPTKLMQSIEWEEEKHPFFLETALKPLRLGVEFVEIPAFWKARTEGESQNGFFENFRYFKTAWRVKFMPKANILRVMQK